METYIGSNELKNVFQHSRDLLVKSWVFADIDRLSWYSLREVGSQHSLSDKLIRVDISWSIFHLRKADNISDGNYKRKEKLTLSKYLLYQVKWKAKNWNISSLMVSTANSSFPKMA